MRLKSPKPGMLKGSMMEYAFSFYDENDVRTYVSMSLMDVETSLAHSVFAAMLEGSEEQMVSVTDCYEESHISVLEAKSTLVTASELKLSSELKQKIAWIRTLDSWTVW